MKKLCLITLAFLMVILLCVGLASCGKLEQVATESGFTVEGGSFKKGSVLNADTVTEEKAAEILEKLEAGGIAVNDKSKAYIYDTYFIIYFQPGCHLCSILQSLAKASSHVLLFVITSKASCGALWQTIAIFLPS